MAYTLYHAQEKILEKLYRMKSAVIAPQCGFGKSLCVLHLAKHLQETEGAKTIFCIPKSARAAFSKEMEKKLELPYLMINSDSPLRDISLLNNYSFIFIEFTVLGNYVESLVQFVKDNPSYIFIDEAQALCSPKSAQTTYMRMIRQNCIGCFSITATPILTDIEGLFYLYQFTFPSLKVFQVWTRFRSLYCITQDKTIRMMGKKRIIKEIVGYKNMEELYSLLDKITIKAFVEYNVEYHFMKTQLENDRLEKYKLAAKGILVTEDEKEWGPRLHDLQRVVDGLPLEDEPVREYSKVRLLLDVLKQIMDRNEATLIYVEYMDTIDYLKEVLENHKEELNYNSIMTLSGKEKEEKRQQIEQNLASRDIVIITKAGRASRNLQKANNLILYNVPYSIGDLLQCPCKGTKILTDKGYINVEDLEDTFNVVIHNNIYPARKLGVKKSKVVEVCLQDNNKLKVSRDHEFLDFNNKWVSVNNLKPQMRLQTNKNTFIKVKSVSLMKNEEEDVYLITVDSDEHAYVTNNLISHNCSGRICRVDTTFDKQNFYILEVDQTIDSYRIALFKDHLALLDRLLGKECRGTLTCDYVEINRMKMKDLKKSLLWRTK